MNHVVNALRESPHYTEIIPVPPVSLGNILRLVQLNVLIVLLASTLLMVQPSVLIVSLVSSHI
jgi:hypothetical protein